jgi:ABC transporter with metal-binding/Fe-S-binding domain ATP-binding protein
MRLAALCSGGKDSTFALWLATKEGHEVEKIVAMIPAREDSWMYHVPNIRLVDLYAECAGIPLVKAETGGERESEIEDLKRVLQGIEAEGVVSGAIASTYQKSRIEGVCRELGLKSLTPLWGRDPVELLHEMLESGFEVIITGVAAEGLDESWLGRRLDEKCAGDLIELHRKLGIHISAEGGEYETLVLDAPFFGKRIKPVKTRRVWRGTHGFLLIERAEVVEK